MDVDLRSRIMEAGDLIYDVALESLEDGHGLEDIYEVLTVVIDDVEDKYECMHCDADCHDCCSQLPLVTYCEWVQILKHLHSGSTMAFRKQLVDRCHKLLDDSGSALPLWMKMKEMDLDDPSAADTIDTIFSNESTQCPLLVEGLCSVYQVRPLICRAYGRMMRSEEDSLYCQPIVNKLLPIMQSGQEIELPVYKHYQELSYSLEGNRAYFTLLPVWILSHESSDGDIDNRPHDIGSNSEWPVLPVKWGFAQAFE